jgi:hypothetical protein
MAIEHTLYLEESYGITSDVADLTPPDVQRAYAAALLIMARPTGCRPASEPISKPGRRRAVTRRA